MSRCADLIFNFLKGNFFKEKTEQCKFYFKGSFSKTAWCFRRMLCLLKNPQRPLQDELPNWMAPGNFDTPRDWIIKSVFRCKGAGLETFSFRLQTAERVCKQTGDLTGMSQKRFGFKAQEI